MASGSPLNRLTTRLVLGFLAAAVVGVALVAVLAYRSTTSEFRTFVGHVGEMDRVMGGGMGQMMGGRGFMGGLDQAQNDFQSGLTRALWIAGIVGGLVAIGLGGLLAWTIVRPLGRVTNAARRIARGELETRVQADGADEVAELGQAFNSMAAALQRDRDLRHNMMADIAHELRTPLSVLRGNVEAMLDGVTPPDRENLQSLHEETLLLGRLVDDLRTLTLAEAGRLELRPEPTDMAELARQTARSLEPQASAKGIRLALELPPAPPHAQVDPDRTTQALRNLLTNAIRYSPQGSVVTVRVVEDREGVVVSAADNGPGIPLEDVPHLFERFFRADRSRSRATGGSGLGLAIVKQLIEAQGGQVWAKSGVGQGSEFSFRVPLAR
ncbi:MAG: ATP-binding protein [Chloroflexota bacterium]|nr:ATP-binding protein [Chloroflexota bacterium]